MGEKDQLGRRREEEKRRNCSRCVRVSRFPLSQGVPFFADWRWRSDEELRGERDQQRRKEGKEKKRKRTVQVLTCISLAAQYIW
jgi:hypothetical protein